MPTTVFNVYKNPEYKDSPNYRYIGRPSPYENPYKMTRYSRAEAVEHFKARMEYGIVQGKLDREYFQVLDGQYLGCFCKPQACHGDVLQEICAISLDDKSWSEYLADLQAKATKISSNYTKPE